MDRSGQQLGYSNGIVNSIALRSESTIGHCEMYSTKNECLCMAVKDKYTEFGTLPTCNKMCMKQNINIYIENYETEVNNLKCSSTNINAYPYYEEEKMSKINNLYIGRNLPKWCETSSKPDNVENWESEKKCSNMAYYPYFDSKRPYFAGRGQCVNNQKEIKPSINQVEVNISPAVESSLAYNKINKKYVCRENIKKDRMQMPEQNASVIVAEEIPPSTCNNLYVAPPYFTVDKFVNQEQSDARRNMQGVQSCMRDFYNYPKAPPTVGNEYITSKNRTENFLFNNKEQLININQEQLVGMKLVDSPNIPLMYLKKSVDAVSLDLNNQSRYLPIKKGICNYKKRYNHVNVEEFSAQKNSNGNASCQGDFNMRNDFVKNKHGMCFPVDQCKDKNAIEIENSNLNAGYSIPTRNNRPNIAIHDVQYVQYQKNAAHETCIKSSCSNLLTSPTKNMIRETRKPNYRELINHAHALRNATTEDDLNMQIIKRTLNYNPLAKEVVVPTEVPKKYEQNPFPSDLITKAFDKPFENKPLKTYDQSNLVNATTNISPLDLSVKTVKTKADSTESNSNHDVLLSENGFPPKFNFMPNFSENRSVISTVERPNVIARNGTGFNFIQAEQGQYNARNKSKTDPVINFTKQVNQLNKVKENSIDFALSKDLPLQVPKSKLHDNTVNCITPLIVQTCVSQETEHGTGIKLEVTLKRTVPFVRDDETESLPKKQCFGNFLRVDCNNTPFQKCMQTPEDTVKTETQITPQVTSNINSFNESLSRGFQQLHDDIKSETLPQADLQQNISSKQDVSSIIAARIRTKAELKGFTFQEDKNVFDQKNKENYQYNCSSQFEAEKEEEDLTIWENACKNFVDQLRNSFCKPPVRLIEQKFSGSLISSPLLQLTEVKSEADPESHESSSEKKTDLVEPLEPCDLPSAGLVLNVPNFDNKLLLKTDSECNELKEIDLDTSACIGKLNVFSDEKNRPTLVEGNLIKEKDLIKYKEKSAGKASYEVSSKEHNIEKNSSKTIDLTKISVVRLKREKYASKRYIQNDKTAENVKFQIYKSKNGLPTKKHSNKLGCIFSTINKSTTKKRSLEIVRIKDTAKDNNDAKANTITTRLRHKRLQLQNKAELKGKKDQKTKKLRKHQRKNSSDHEDPEKLYLEVYKYKRALKVPPNLITIKNSTTERMSTSLPDLDLEIQNSLLKNAMADTNNSDRKKDAPKSFIDVLHSRVIKSKSQNKSQNNINSKYSKNEKKKTFKSTLEQCNKSNFSPSNINDNNKHSSQEYRNVFETQVLSSRTRTEYKMQLNREVIREIFGSSERPASAPPEISNSSDYQLVLGQYNTFFQGPSSDIENDNKYWQEGKRNNQLRIYGQESSDASIYSKNTLSEHQTKDIDQCANLAKSKRKRNGRPYRRKFSSGFDYLRKRKKSNTRTSLYNYSQIKTKSQNYLPEANSQLKSEMDVSREIQKWVLNKSVGQSALHKAARLGYIDVIVYGIERMGLNPNHKDNAGYTPLHDACVNGSLEIARILLQYGANHSEGAHSGIRPLHEASENGHMEIVRMLLSYGADPLLETYSGQTPLMLASEPEMSEFLSMHLLDVQMSEVNRNTWKFPGPWKIFDDTENGYNVFSNVTLVGAPFHEDGQMVYNKNNFECTDLYSFKEKKSNGSKNAGSRANMLNNKNNTFKNDVCEFEIIVDATDAEGELFEFEEASMPLPPLYLLKDEGMEKWVLLSDLCSLLKVKSKDTLLHKIFPSVSPSVVSRAFIRELKMCEFLEKATCLQLLCAGEKINICHSKVVLVQYNENVRKFLGVKTFLMQF